MSQLAPALTRQQRWVLDRVALGMSNKEIAQALGISPRTVEIHRAKALACIGARNTVHAAVIWDRASRGEGHHASIAQVLAGAMKVHRLSSRRPNGRRGIDRPVGARDGSAGAAARTVLKAFPDFTSEMEQ
jgi:DNA-binding CsgD family transcriptional regulator